ncbi:hypothetical protein Tco_0428811 [Tanacetum coccineum]
MMRIGRTNRITNNVLLASIELVVPPVEIEFPTIEIDDTVTPQDALPCKSQHRIIAVTKLQIVEWHNYKHLDWITVRRNDDKLYTFKEGDYKRLRLQDIKDMLLLLVQGKLTNLTIEERLALNVSLSDLKRLPTYSAYPNPRGFIYQNKDKKNKLMRIDELHKFSDGTLNDVRTALDDILKRIGMKYLPQTYWKKVDKDRAGAMIQAIDKQLKNRRIMRSLEKFVVIKEYLVNISKRRTFWSLNEDILKIYYSDYQYAVSIKKIRRIRACTHQRSQRNEAQYAVSKRTQYAALKIYFKMDDPNMTMEEYIKFEEEKARRRGRVFNWQTATYGKVRVDNDIYDLRSVELEFPAIEIDDTDTAQDALLFCHPSLRSVILMI